MILLIFIVFLESLSLSPNFERKRNGKARDRSASDGALALKKRVHQQRKGINENWRGQPEGQTVNIIPSACAKEEKCQGENDGKSQDKATDSCQKNRDSKRNSAKNNNSYPSCQGGANRNSSKRQPWLERKGSLDSGKGLSKSASEGNGSLFYYSISFVVGIVCVK